MTRPTPLSQVVADDLLIDRVAGRQPAGDDPIAGLLAALAEHADRPLGRASTGRRFRPHRVLSTFAAVAIGASGAGVAAAATVPDAPPSAALARVAPAAPRSGSAPGAQLVQDATGRVTVIGADGTQVESAWLPGGVSPVLLTPGYGRGPGSGAEVSRYRWVAVGGATALVLAGPEQDDPVNSTGNDQPEKDAGTGAADEAATPMDAAATPVDGTAPAPTDDATPATTPTDDAADVSADQGESDDLGSTADETGSADAGTPTETSTPTTTGTPTPTGTPADTSGAEHWSGTANPAAGDVPHTLPPQASEPAGAPAAGTQVPAPLLVSAPLEDAGGVDASTVPVMVPLPTGPVAVLPDLP